MAINHDKLDTLLGKVLDAHATGNVSRGSAIGAIAHIIAALDRGNNPEAQAWVNDPEVFERWLALALKKAA